MRLIARWKPWVAELLPLEKAIDAAARSLDKRRPALDRVSVERYLKKLPPTRRLVVIIDDLDRATPEVVPHLLLSLREMFDVPGCAFVVALDPAILAKALPSVHPGWGTTSEFIEKIIQFPFWLPRPEIKDLEIKDLLQLAHQSLEELPLSVSRDVVRDLIDLVPKNPRRLKQFFRNILRLRAAIERHDPGEVNWTLLLLLELMRAIAPTVSAELFHDEAFLKLLSQNTVLGRGSKDKHSEGSQKEFDDALNRACARLGIDDPRTTEELRKVVSAFPERLGFVGPDGMKYWAQLSENPPIFTWREFRSLLDDWRGDKMPESLRRLAATHARSRELNIDTVARDLFQTALHHRQQLLGRAADTDLATDLERIMQEANEVLLLTERIGLATEPMVLSVDEIHLLYQQVVQWAHFTNLDVYIRTRAAEKDFLMRVANKIDSTLAVSELGRLQLWMPFREAGRQPEAKSVSEAFARVLVKTGLEDVRPRFTRPDGIGSLWGKDRALVEKYLLFRADSGFYSADTLNYLRGLVARAADSTVVQQNFLEFLRLLAHGATDRLGVVSQEDVVPLVKNLDLVGVAWKAATTMELQPRTAGSLKETRAVLAKIAETDDHLPLPRWWAQATDDVQKSDAADTPATLESEPQPPTS